MNWQHTRDIFRNQILTGENLSAIFDAHIYPRYEKKQFKPKYAAKRAEMLEQLKKDKKLWIDKLINQTHIEIVRDTNKLIPVDDSSAVAHTRRGVTKKRDYDGAPYAFYFGENFLEDIFETPDGIRDLTRYILDQVQHFDHGDSVEHGDIDAPQEYPNIAPYDHDKYIEHDWELEAYMFSIIMENDYKKAAQEKGEPALPRNEKLLLVTKIRDLFVTACNKPSIRRQTIAEFFCVCYRTLREYVLLHPDDIPLSGTAQVPLRAGIEILPTLLKISSECLNTNMKDRHDLKNPFRVYDCDRGVQIRRRTDGTLGRATRGTTSAPLSAEEAAEWQALLTKINEAQNEKELDALFEAHERHRYDDAERKKHGRDPIGFSSKDFDQYKKERVDMILHKMNIDMATDRAYLVDHVDEYVPFAHTRAGNTQPEGYDGAPYAVNVGKIFLEVLFLGTTGKKDFQRLIVEESKHFATDRHYGHGYMKKRGDSDRYVEHDQVFLDKCELICDLAETTLRLLNGTLPYRLSMTKEEYLYILNLLKTEIDTDYFYSLLLGEHKNITESKEKTTAYVSNLLCKIYSQIDNSVIKNKSHDIDVFFNYLNRFLIKGFKFKRNDTDRQFSITNAMIGYSPDMSGTIIHLDTL